MIVGFQLFVNLKGFLQCLHFFLSIYGHRISLRILFERNYYFCILCVSNTCNFNASHHFSFSRDHRNELDDYCTKCDVILEQIQHLLGALKELQSKYTFVLTQTRALHDACEQSIQEQVSILLVTFICFHSGFFLYFRNFQIILNRVLDSHLKKNKRNLA